jgi:hypothetical protein
LSKVEIHDTSDQPGAPEFSIFSGYGIPPAPPAREKADLKRTGSNSVDRRLIAAARSAL